MDKKSRPHSYNAKSATTCWLFWCHIAKWWIDIGPIYQMWILPKLLFMFLHHNFLLYVIFWLHCCKVFVCDWLCREGERRMRREKWKNQMREWTDCFSLVFVQLFSWWGKKSSTTQFYIGIPKGLILGSPLCSWTMEDVQHGMHYVTLTLTSWQSFSPMRDVEESDIDQRTEPVSPCHSQNLEPDTEREGAAKSIEIILSNHFTTWCKLYPVNPYFK